MNNYVFLDLNHALELQSTRSSVECGVSQEEFLSAENTCVTHIVTVASPCSTNSSVDEYHGVDRSVFDDLQYGNYSLISEKFWQISLFLVRAQEHDLYRLIDMEIDLSKDLSYLQRELLVNENHENQF